MADEPATSLAPDEAQTRQALEDHRPELVAAYLAELPGARAAILGRLWGALAREPIPGVVRRTSSAGTRTLTLADGRSACGETGAAEPFAVLAPGAAVTVDGVPHHRPDRLLAALRLPGAGDRLAREVANSVANLALARAARTRGTHRAGRGGAPTDLTAVEQSVVDGHPLHPCCRTRVGLSTMDVLAYAPEHRPVVDLALVAVAPGHWLSTGTATRPVLPVHPAQLARVLRTGLVRDTGRTLPARPLMSLRTVAPLGDPTTHLKTALDVQMTSAVRIVSPAAIRNGPAVSALMREVTRRTPMLTVLAEPSGGAVLVDGEPCASMAAVWREAPRLYPGECAIPLAALTASAPGGQPLVAWAVASGYAGRPGPFLTDLLGTLLPPLLTLLHLGVALEAHGQNTLLVLRGGRPTRVLYRDLGGVRISADRLAAAGFAVPPLHGDLAADDPTTLTTKLVAAAVSTVLAELVAVLARRYGEPPAELWGRVAAAVRDSYAALPGHAPADRAAMFGDVLPVKAMTAMRLADDPLTDRWAEIRNPMAGLS